MPEKRNAKRVEVTLREGKTDSSLLFGERLYVRHAIDTVQSMEVKAPRPEELLIQVAPKYETDDCGRALAAIAFGTSDFVFDGRMVKIDFARRLPMQETGTQFSTLYLTLLKKRSLLQQLELNAQQQIDRTFCKLRLWSVVQSAEGLAPLAGPLAIVIMLVAAAFAFGGGLLTSMIGLAVLYHAGLIALAKLVAGLAERKWIGSTYSIAALAFCLIAIKAAYIHNHILGFELYGLNVYF